MVVLVNTPLKLNEYKFTSLQYPINLGYLASVLKKEKIKVEIWDYAVEKFNEKKFVNRLKNTNPEIIGFSCITPNITTGNYIAQIVKEIKSEIITVVGGPHTTSLPQRTLEEFKYFDFAVIGEGEKIFFNLCSAIYRNESFEKIKGIAYRKNKNIITNEMESLIEDIDSIPYPDRTLVDISLYKYTHPTKIIPRYYNSIAEMLTSRGCPYNCFFCAGHNVFQNAIRLRTRENIEGEILLCKKKFNINHITFIDNTFTLNKKRTLQISKILKELNITYDCNSRVDTIDEEILNIMANSGCKKISFGIESGSQRMLDNMNKKTNISQIKNAIISSKKLGIEIIEGTVVIGGHPDETPQDVEDTKKLLMNLPLDFLVVDVIVPYPSSPVYHYMKKENLIFEEDWNKFTPYGILPVWRTKYFEPHQLVKIQKKLMFKFYFRWKYIFKRIKGLKNLYELLYYFRMLINFLWTILVK